MNRKVLIVEDEVLNAMSLATLIRAWGYEVVDMVTSGEDAVQAAVVHRPDVVLIDICIHGQIDGLGAAREIVDRFRIPVIFMTGYDDEETVKAAMELKALAFLVKPFHPDRVKEALRAI